MSSGLPNADQKKLCETLKANPSDWATRKQLAHLLYDQGSFPQAADVIWSADEIPSIDIELAFAVRILAKATPRKAIRLLTALLEHNRGKAVQNLGLANALLHHGMVLQAARFYGAALEADPTLGNPELEHFILWTDDQESLWGDFSKRKPKLGELPWMKRDPQEALKLTSKISHHTTPIKLPGLAPAAGEELKNDFYQQKPEKGADPTPPPAVTIPLDRVAPKDRLFDEKLGAPTDTVPVKIVVPVATAATVKPPIPAVISAAPPTIPLVAAATPTARPRPALPPLKRP